MLPVKMLRVWGHGAASQAENMAAGQGRKDDPSVGREGSSRWLSMWLSLQGIWVEEQGQWDSLGIWAGESGMVAGALRENVEGSGGGWEISLRPSTYDSHKGQRGAWT